MTQTAPSLIGLICDDVDPAAQLIAGQLRARGERFVSTRDAFAVGDVADRLIVTSQDIYLSDLQKLLRNPTPVDLIIRRPRGGETEAEWKIGLDLLARGLENDANMNVQCFALTQAAADELSLLTSRTVLPLEPLPQVSPPRGKAVIEGPEIRFLVGSRNTCMPLRDANWWRIRKRAVISCGLNSPTDTLDLVAFSATNNDATTLKPNRTKTYLFVASNGVGLGHLTRLLAIAKNLDGRVIFWSYSQAAQLIAEAGYSVIPRLTAEHLSAKLDVWNEWEALDFSNIVAQEHVDAIVYDGSSPPKGLLDAMIRPEAGDTDLIWVRRGMWHEEADTSPLLVMHHFDLIIEPGDLADSVDIGPTRTMQVQYQGNCKFLKSEPIVATSPEDMLSRRKARAALKHRSLRPLCLVNLGGDSLSNHAPLIALLERIAPNERIQFIWLRSPFATGAFEAKGTIRQIRQFPISPMLNAFDGIISAAGYNSFHETLALSGAPVLFAPNQNARLDDQFARAAYAQDQGWAHLLDQHEDRSLERQVNDFLDLVRTKKTVRIQPNMKNGTATIANAIEDAINNKLEPFLEP